MLIMTSPRHRGLTCDRSGGAADAVRDCSSSALPRPERASLRAWMTALGQAPTRGRHGAAGDVNSGRFLRLSPRPVAALQPVPVALRLPLSLSSLTPARWQSKRLDVQSRGKNGPGGAVPNGTSPELARNFHPIDNYAFFAQFRSSAPEPRVHVRGRVYASVRAYMRGGFSGTPEPTNYIVIEQRVIGSKSGSAQFRFGTNVAADCLAGRKLSVINILSVGYSSDLGQWACSTVIRGRPAKTFGLGVAGGGSAAPIEGLDLVDQARSPWRSENGGFPPISGARWAHVGTMMLERWAQGTAIAGLSGSCRLPVRLTRAALVEAPGGSAGPSAPPLAPIATASLPSMPAHERGQIWNGPAFRDRGPERGAAGGREAWGGTIGSGWSVAGRKTRKLAAGRGCGGGVQGAPGRRAHGRTGGVGVN